MRLIAALVLTLLTAVPAGAQEKAPPGKFDYFVLSLSWSPTWCATRSGRNDDEQCGTSRPYGFVVHGLWPQFANGGYPAECAAPTPVPSRIEDMMLPIMPSRKLIRHEWRRHGTCAGTSPEAYFDRTREAFAKVRIPEPFRESTEARHFTVPEVEAMFAAANPGLSADALSVVCRGRHGAEVRVCLDTGLNFRSCGRDVQDRCKGRALFPAVR